MLQSVFLWARVTVAHRTEQTTRLIPIDGVGHRAYVTVINREEGMALSDAETIRRTYWRRELPLDADFRQHLVCGQFGVRCVVGGAAESGPVGRVQVGVLVCPAGSDLRFYHIDFYLRQSHGATGKAPGP